MWSLYTYTRVSTEYQKIRDTVRVAPYLFRVKEKTDQMNSCNH